MKDSRRKNKARFTTDDFEAKVNYKIRFSDTGLKSGAKTKSNEISKWMNIVYVQGNIGWWHFLMPYRWMWSAGSKVKVQWSWAGESSRGKNHWELSAEGIKKCGQILESGS